MNLSENQYKNIYTEKNFQKMIENLHIKQTTSKKYLKNLNQLQRNIKILKPN